MARAGARTAWRAGPAVDAPHGRPRYGRLGRWTVGLGHSSPVVAAAGSIVFSRQGEEETLQALDLATGKRLWRQAYPAPYTMNSAAFSHGPGPKATPVVAGDGSSPSGISGILSAYDAASGRVLWRKEFAKEFPSTSPIYRGGAVAGGGRGRA